MSEDAVIIIIQHRKTTVLTISIAV